MRKRIFIILVLFSSFVACKQQPVEPTAQRTTTPVYSNVNQQQTQDPNPTTIPVDLENLEVKGLYYSQKNVNPDQTITLNDIRYEFNGAKHLVYEAKGTTLNPSTVINGVGSVKEKESAAGFCVLYGFTKFLNYTVDTVSTGPGVLLNTQGNVLASYASKPFSNFVAVKTVTCGF